MTAPAIRHVGILGYEGVNGLDLVAPIEVFASANELNDGAAPLYRVHVVGLDCGPFRSESGIGFTPDVTLAEAPAFDTLIVPGGAGLRAPGACVRAAAWLKTRAPLTRRVASVCTGLYGLAETGLLDGLRVTTHWRFAADLARRYPALRMDANALFVREGRFYTAAGVTAGVDLALALVEEDHGPRLALAIARDLVVYFKRPGGQLQYSEPLQFQARAVDRFADLAAWLPSHLGADLSVEALARRANLSPRHFTRRFKEAFGVSPADYVESLRLDTARSRLGAPGQTIDSVAGAAGFNSADVFRRAFERRFGVAPSAYRRRFGLDDAALARAKA